MKARLLLKGLLLMASLLAIGWAVEASGLSGHLDSQWVDSSIRGKGSSGWLIYAGIGALAVALGAPRQAVCFLGGYAFGLGLGVVLAEAASIISCIVVFFYSRLFARDLVRHRFAERLDRLDAFLQDHPLSMTVLVRFLPVGSNLLTTMVAGVSSVRPLPFIAGSLIGYLPQTVIFVLLGSGIHVQPFWRTTVSVVLFLLSAVTGVYLYRRLRHGRSLDSAID
jgi:uncharacterized membrane protein YdjX (TVP38/TMEM64 family)